LSAAELSASVERLSGTLVLADPGDLNALAAVHTDMEELGRLAADAGNAELGRAAGRAGDLLKSLILGEVADADAAFGTLSQAVSALQAMARGAALDESGFPAELLGGRGVPATANPAVDEQILSEFLSRQPGVMQEFEALALALEAGSDGDGGGGEGLASLRRLVHTLKGESALLGLGESERLCHSTEDYLDGSGTATTDLLLEVKDWLSRYFSHRAGRGERPEDVAGLLARLGQKRQAAPKPAAAPAQESSAPQVAVPASPAFDPAEADVSLVSDFVTEAREHLHNADVHLLTLETDPHDTEAINAVFRAFHTIKGVAGFLALDEIGGLAHDAESLLDRSRKGELAFTGSAVDVTFDAVDALKERVDALAGALAEGRPLDRRQELGLLRERLQAVAAGRADPAGTVGRHHHAAPAGKRLGEILVERGQASAESVEAAAKKQQEEPAGKLLGEILVRQEGVPAKEVAQALRSQRGTSVTRVVQVRDTVKVDAERLDRLVDTIGELVIAESMVSRSARLNGHGDAALLLGQLGQLDKITRELQEMGTGLRMVPVRATFQKMARLVRDLAHKAGKNVEFVMTGEETELDKSVVDQIGDPLVHMIRNAVDHGIEATAEARRAAGKSAVGRVELRAYHKGGSIYIEVADDGRGLDRARILAKAREKGLVSPEAELSERETFNIIFMPGFSTAEKITDVSGRGVGMDVVRRNIEALRGQVEIRSEPGRGSTFVMRLPLTLAIIDGMVVRVRTERYIIPTLSIVRTVAADGGNVESVLGRGEMLKLQGRLLPLFRLAELFAAPGDERGRLAVVVDDDGRQAALAVDELLGQQQIVIKSLGEALRGQPGLSGGAVMPDGTVGLILDVGGLVRLAHENVGEPRPVGAGHSNAEGEL
jgi:two-component system chemotaxis sensor kinase CheA